MAPPRKKKQISLEEALSVLEEHGYSHFTPIKPVSVEVITAKQDKAQVIDKGYKNTITIHLRCNHTVNGESYGPGQVTVTRRLSTLLLEQDHRAVAQDQRMLGGERRAYLITRQVYTDNKQAIVGIPVPADTFENFNLEAIKPFGSIG